jgi:hypothetical protein
MDLSLAQDLVDISLRDNYIAGGDLIPLTEFPGGDPNLWGENSIGKTRNQKYMYSPDDFSDGSFPPYYVNEIDLARHRAEARNVKQLTSTMIGATTSLTNYVVHTGYTFEITPKKEFASPEIEKLANTIQSVLDKFLEANKFVGKKDRAIHIKATDEGEYILALYPSQKTRSVRIKEIPNECLTEPRDKESITNWLIKTGQIERGIYNWSYGVLTKFNKEMNDFDPTPIGYHFSYNNSGTRYDYIPAERIVYIKFNTESLESAKRGISDWYEVIQDVRDELKLRGNTSHSAIFNAAIIGIRQHSAGTTKDQVRTLHDRLANAERIREGKSSSTTRKVSINDRPHIADISNGMEWMAGPLGSLNHPIFIEIIQMILKAIGRRWNMPEYLISQDASNSNYASTLVSEAPFVKTVEARQALLIMEFEAMIWKVVCLLRSMLKNSLLQRYSTDFMKEVLTISIKTPEVVTRDPDKLTTRLETLHNNRVISKRTWASKEDLDFDEESANMEQEPDDFNSSFNNELETNTKTIY